MARTTAPLLFLLCACAGCGGATRGAPGDLQPGDGGPAAVADGGGGDDGFVPPDGGSTVDGGPTVDGGGVADGGRRDGGSATDAGAVPHCPLPVRDGGPVDPGWIGGRCTSNAD